MKIGKIIKALVIILSVVAYVFLANAIKTTEYGWIFTRIFGMTAITLLFLVAFLGELRLLGYHKFFKFHHFLGMTTFYVVILHFISAIFDKFSWGKTLSFIDYLGTNFSNQWMIALSIGAIAFYLMILVGFTSAYPVLRKIGYKNWKLIHLLTYLTLIFVFWHSIILGTEFNRNDYKLDVFAITTFVFMALMSLLALRIGKVKFDTGKKIIGILFLVLTVSGAAAYFSTRIKIYAAELELVNQQNSKIILQIEDLTLGNANIEKFNAQMQTEIDKLKQMSAKFTNIKPVQNTQPQPTPVIEPSPQPSPIIEPPPIEEDNKYNNYENDDRNEYEDD